MGHQLLHLTLDVEWGGALPLGLADVKDESGAGGEKMYNMFFQKLFQSNKTKSSIHLCRRMGLNMKATVTAPQNTWPSSKLPRPDHSHVREWRGSFYPGPGCQPTEEEWT